MPRKSKFNLPPLNLGEESIGERITKIRKQKGFTQKQLAEKIGIIQAIISSYERGRVNLSVEMTARFATALGVTTDEIIGHQLKKEMLPDISLRYVKRIQQIEKMPEHKQKIILKMLDAFIKDNES